jgi:PIN domain nuclease of toxin-antitoxin system
VSSEVNLALADPNDGLFLSPVSVRELVVHMDKDDQRRYRVLGHQDPADRFLATTAGVYAMTLVPAGERLLRVPSLNVLANG